MFRYRWGDAQTRVFTLAMFASEEEVFLSRSAGYVHGRGKCLPPGEKPVSFDIEDTLTFKEKSEVSNQIMKMLSTLEHQ